MSADQYLKLRKGRRSFYFQRAVPSGLQNKFGKVISTCFKTADRKKARLLRDTLVAEWSRKFEVERTHL